MCLNGNGIQKDVSVKFMFWLVVEGEDVPTVADVAQQEEMDQQEAEEGEGPRWEHREVTVAKDWTWDCLDYNI